MGHNQRKPKTRNFGDNQRNLRTGKGNRNWHEKNGNRFKGKQEANGGNRNRRTGIESSEREK